MLYSYYNVLIKCKGNKINVNYESIEGLNTKLMFISIVFAMQNKYYRN